MQDANRVAAGQTVFVEEQKLCFGFQLTYALYASSHQRKNPNIDLHPRHRKGNFVLAKLSLTI